MPETVEFVEDWMIANGNQKRYTNRNEPMEIFSESWLQVVDGANLLDKLFEEISSGVEFYKKTEHSLELTKWLIQNQPNTLTEILEFLIEIIPDGHQSETVSHE